MITPLTEQSEIDQREDYRKRLFDEFLKSDYYDPLDKSCDRDFMRFLADKLYDQLSEIK